MEENKKVCCHVEECIRKPKTTTRVSMMYTVLAIASADTLQNNNEFKRFDLTNSMLKIPHN